MTAEQILAIIALVALFAGIALIVKWITKYK